MRATVHPEFNARVRPGARIISVQPDRDRAFVEVIGECGHEGVGELRQRLDGLLTAGARFVLVDLTEADEVAQGAGLVLAAARRQLTRREGWLRTVGHHSGVSAARCHASLLDVFTMYRAAVRDEPGRSPATRSAMSPEHRGDPIVGGARCLIVDDNERFLTVAQNRLARDGMAVVGTATSRAEALQQAASLRPDIVLVDINLGRESGFELTCRLVENFPELHGRMVLISTYDEDDYVDLIKASPAVGFITKSRLSARAICTLLRADG